MKKNNSHLRIYIRTASVFLAFYLVMMIVITYLYSNDIRKNMQEKTNAGIQILDINVMDYAQQYLENKANGNKNVTSVNYIENLYQQMSNVMRNLATENIYIRANLYDGKDNFIAKTGNVLFFEDYISIGNGRLPGSHKFIPLDEFMSQDQINKLFYGNNLWYNIVAKITGYETNSYVIPQKIQLYDSYGNEKVSIEKTFNHKNVNGLKLVEYPRDYAEADFERIGQSGIITQTMHDRYSYCDMLAKPSLDLFRKEGSGFSGPIKDNVFKGTQAGILMRGGFRDSTSCYMNYGIVYYPLEVAIPQLTSVYILCFIFVLILIILLSKRLTKIYKQQTQLENNRRDLTNAIAHELKTPLGIIRSYSEGLKEKIAEDKKDYYLDVIIDETEQMDKMVLEMLDLSKLEANAYKLHSEQFSLKDLVLKKIERYKNILEEKQININFVCDEDYKIIADITSFEQIISNFISNAINHTPVGKNIKISIESVKNDVLFSIENQGEHIPQDQMPKIWDSFYKVDNSRERKNGGTGLGLAIAKNHLRLHNAHYGCENTADGVRFWFSINSSI